MRLDRRQAIAGILALAGCGQASEQLRVAASAVSTFSILADFTVQLLGNANEIQSLVGPDADAHVFDPSPSHAALVSQASVVIENGLGFEPWSSRLREAASYSGKVVVASEHIVPILFEQTPDPHAWQDATNARQYVRNIATGLSEVFPAQAEAIRTRAAKYDLELEVLDRDIRTLIDSVPPDRRVIVTSHDAFSYFGRAYGVRFLAPIGLNTEEDPSPTKMRALIEQIRRERVTALFIENMSDGRLLQAIAEETGVRIGGKLYSDALSAPGGEASTYLNMMRFNSYSMARTMA